MASIIVDFISINGFKEVTGVQYNVDDSTISPFIQDAQNNRLVPVIGDNLFDRLKDGIVNGTLTNDEKLLMDNYIQPQLYKWTLFESMLNINFKYTNKSISKESSQYSTPSDSKEIHRLRREVRNDAESLNFKLQDYLNKNSDLYPEYIIESCNNSNGDIYFNGIYLPRR